MKTASSILVSAAEAIAHRNVELRSFLLRLLNPDDLGYSVTPEVRTEIVRMLNTANTNRGERK